jgi:cytochrome d ubiquinol oxidase subunit II
VIAMMTMFSDPAHWLPVAFAGLMGLSILIYVILDGFDLGVGVLFPLANDAEKDRMVGSIGPFWDANETWLVMAIGLLLVAFPAAHGQILTAFYAPVAVMLIGLILRGVAFEFRAKAPDGHKAAWNVAFFAGSLMASLAQGFMLGLYVLGLEQTVWSLAFAALTALCLTAGYAFIGAAWLVMKTAGDLQRKAFRWARLGLIGSAVGLAAISAATPLASPDVLARWFSMPEILLLAPLPLTSAVLLAGLWVALGALPDMGPQAMARWDWTPFAGAASLFTLGFAGFAYSFYPWVIPGRMTIFEAASAPESLLIILVGACVVLPVIVGYSILAFTVFRGKAEALEYY